jgi:hypothetical protein
MSQYQISKKKSVQWDPSSYKWTDMRKVYGAFRDTRRRLRMLFYCEQWRHEFDTRTVHIVSVGDKVTMERVLLLVFRFSLISYKPTSASLIHLWMLYSPKGPGGALWSRHCATRRRIAGSIPSDVAGKFFRSYRRNHVPWGRLSL